MASVLIVDDLPAVHEMLESVINPVGHNSAFALTGQEALKIYKKNKFDVVLCDIAMQPMDGITLLKEIKAYDPQSTVIMMTGFATADTAVQALKFGAFDFLHKPFRVDELVKTINRAVDSKSQTADVPQHVMQAAMSAKEKEIAEIDCDVLVGESEEIQSINKLIDKLIGVSTPILIEGEVGTGKKSLAHYIHCKSKYNELPFKYINCAKIEAEAFTKSLFNDEGAPGTLFDGGTIYLHSIDVLPLDIQIKLSEALHAANNSYRLICSADKNLESLMESGKISDEFFFKIASLPISIPPLRERVDDIPLLIKEITLRTVNPHFKTVQIEFSYDAEEIMMKYIWPGNLTELTNVVFAITAAAKDTEIDVHHLPKRIKEPNRWSSLDDYLVESEKRYLSNVLNFCRNDKLKAADLAKVDKAKFDNL